MKRIFFSILIFLLASLPFWFLYGLSTFGYYLLYYVIGYRKKVVFKNLSNAFPEKTQAERLAIAKEFYKYLPDIFVEAIKMRRISAKEVQKRVFIENQDELLRHLQAGKNVIGITAHYCNWELGIHRLSLLSQDPVLIVYKPLNNKIFDDLYNTIRSKFGALMVPMKQILRHILRLKGTPNVSMFVADQTPTYQDSDYFIEFLNQDTLVYTGAARLAKLSQAPVVFCQIGRYPKRGHYYCKFTTLVEDPSQYEEHEITQIHNKFTEDIIRQQPAYWLWSHNRWKRQRRT